MAESKMISLLWECYRDKKYTDLSIVYQGVTYGVHKAVVCKQSPVLEAMCSSNFKEGQDSIINLDGDDDLDAKQIKCLIEYLYKFKYCSFGARPSTKSTSNLFGPPTTTTTTTSTPSASASASATPSFGSLFGSRPTSAVGTSATAPSASGGLFGGTGSSSTTSTTATNPVGVSTASASPHPTGGLFGSTISTGSTDNRWTVPHAAAPTTTTGGLFGSAAAAGSSTSANTTTTTTTTTSTPQPPTTGGLFAAARVASASNSITLTPRPTSSLFGGSKPSLSPSPTATTTPVSKQTQVSLDSDGNILTAKFHAQMYALADKYDIKDLGEHSKQMYAKTLEEHGAPIASTEFYDSIVTVYTSTPESDRGLRDIVALYAKKHNSWLWRHRLREIIAEVPMFAADVLDLMV